MDVLTMPSSAFEDATEEEKIKKRREKSVL